MVLLLEVLRLLTLVLVFVLMPAILMVALYLMSRRYRGMFDRIGFTRKEIGLLVFGSLAASLVSIDVPFIVFGNYLLAINVAGALIPTVLSIHLLRAKRIHPLSWSLGILGVAGLTFFITRVQPRHGIVAEFPWLFLPSLTAAALALILYSRRSPKAPAYAYATATLGSLIGADFFHLPELFAAPGFVGSFGGAGVYDLVYLAGVLSLALVLLFATSNLRTLRATLPAHEKGAGRLHDELASSTEALVKGFHQASVQRTLVAVQMRLRQLAPPGASLQEAVDQCLSDDRARRAYSLLSAYAPRSDSDAEVAHWAMFQGQYVLEHLEKVQRGRYASAFQRAGAFAVDAAAIAVVLVLMAAAVLRFGEDLAEPFVLAVALIFWAWSFQMVYFTAFEYFWKGQSLGKRLLRLRVADLDGRPPDFITAFTRNVVRLLDFAMVFYAGAVLVMLASRRVQRLGDMVAQTVVLRRPPPPSPASPPMAWRPAVDPKF